MTGPVTTEALVEGLRTDHLAAIDACLRASETNGEVPQNLRLREREAAAALISTLLAAHQQVTAERDEARDLAYDLKLAAAGGEDVPGSANLVTPEDVRRWRDEDTRRLAAANAKITRLQEGLQSVAGTLESSQSLLMTVHFIGPERAIWEAGGLASQIVEQTNQIRTALARAATAREG